MDILKLVNNFKSSSVYNDMLTGERYFTSKTDILKRKFYYYPNSVRVVDPYRANNRIVDNFFKMLVEQKVSYCVAQDVVINNYIPLFDVNDFIDEAAEEASIKGKAWAHPYMNKINALKVAIIPAQEVIPIYDETIEKNLVNVIRFFTNMSGVEKVELWDSEQVIYYKVDKKVGLIIEETKKHNWGKVPFVCLINNRYEINDLDNIKALIDSYDKVISDFANNFEDFQDVYYKIKNYSGSTNKVEDVANIIEFIKQYHMIPVSADGDFEAIQLEIPHVSRETYLKHVRGLIFLFGQGVDTDILSGGSLTNVVIKARFANLEQKCNKFIKILKRFIEELMYFDVVFKQNTGNTETDLRRFDITFNTTLLINENEKIDCVVASDGLISEETNIAQHPFVNDVKVELDKKREDELNYNNNNLVPGTEKNKKNGTIEK